MLIAVYRWNATVIDKDLYVGTISGLVERFGGYGNLAEALNVNVDDLRYWGQGLGRPPVEIFLRMADLLNEPARAMPGFFLGGERYTPKSAGREICYGSTRRNRPRSSGGRV